MINSSCTSHKIYTNIIRTSRIGTIRIDVTLFSCLQSLTHIAVQYRVTGSFVFMLKISLLWYKRIQALYILCMLDK
jgi:hypothetical protein